MDIKYYFNQIIRNENFKNFSKLFSGYGLSQALLIASSPILSRIYSPSDFAVLAIVSSFSLILSSFISGKYELAIMIPRKEEDAEALFLSSRLFTFIFTLSLLLLTYLMKDKIINSIDELNNGFYVLIIPFLAFYISNNNAFNLFQNRNKRFGLISKSLIIGSIFNFVISISLGYIFIGPLGLVLGFFSNFFFRYIYFYFKSNTISVVNYKRFKSKLFFVLKKYRRFPIFMIPGAFMNTLAIEIPVILLSLYFSSSSIEELSIVGQYSFCYKVMNAPLMMFSNSYAETYRQKLSDNYQLNSHKGLLISKVLFLLKTSIIPIIILFIIIPKLFLFIFGSDWVIASEMARYILIMVYFKFLLSPLSSIIIQASQKLHIDIYWQAGRLILSFIGIYIGYMYGSYMLSVVFYGLAMVLSYLSSFLIALVVKKKEIHE